MDSLKEKGSKQPEYMTQTSLKGTVRWFCPQKGYGFILVGGIDIFVHYTNIAGEGYRTLREGDNVIFDIERDPNGKDRAVNVVRV